MATVQSDQQVSQPAGSVQAARVDAETATTELAFDAQVDEIVARLQQRYSGEQISRVELEGRVRHFHRRFSGAQVRNFVSVLVESLVRRSVADEVGHLAAAASR